MYLDALQISESKEERPYFYKGQVEKIKAIHDLITTDLQEHYTMDELAERFQISLTGMKNCFKEVYGDSMYSYLRRYRMNIAATMLRQDSKGIAEIAGAVGYESPSKFATAFRQVMGQTPMEYRKSFSKWCINAVLERKEELNTATMRMVSKDYPSFFLC